MSTSPSKDGNGSKRSRDEDEEDAQESPKKIKVDKDDSSLTVVNTNDDKDLSNDNDINKSSNNNNKPSITTKPEDPLKKLATSLSNRANILKTLGNLHADPHKYYTEKDVQEGYKIIAKISQMLEDKQADKRELLLLTYHFYQAIYPTQSSIPSVISTRSQMLDKLQTLHHIHVITRATGLLATSANKPTKILPSDEEADEERGKEDDAEMDDAEKKEEKEKKNSAVWDKSSAQKLVARAHLSLLPPNDPTFLLLLTYISSTNIPKSSFQVMEIFRVGAEGEGTNSNHGGEDKGKEAEGSNNNNSNNGGKDKGEEKVLLWSGGPTCGVLDVLANGWNCEHGVKFFDCVSQVISESNFGLEEMVLTLSEVTLDQNQPILTKKEEVEA